MQVLHAASRYFAKQFMNKYGFYSCFNYSYILTNLANTNHIKLFFIGTYKLNCISSKVAMVIKQLF
jgi:hypothetical protein